MKRDKHQLYQQSVQNVEFEVGFLRRLYRRLRSGRPRVLREDFCGTALLSSEWVRRVPDGRAYGIDLDRSTLDYARKHNLGRLGDRAKRVKLIHADVLEVRGVSADIAVAYNFSYFVFKRRPVLLAYFKAVRRSLRPGGIFALDVYGGPDAQTVEEERTEQEGFTYVWNRASYNPITGETLCRIHFEFPKGPRMRSAFTYDWRLWTLPELRDLLEEAEFARIDVYWEGTDRRNGGGNGVFRPSLKGDDSSSWIAYVIAAK